MELGLCHRLHLFDPNKYFNFLDPVHSHNMLWKFFYIQIHYSSNIPHLNVQPEETEETEETIRNGPAND